MLGVDLWVTNFPMGNFEASGATGDPVAAATATAIRVGLARKNSTQAALAGHLHLSQPAVHRRMVGKVPWRLDELMEAATFLGVSVTDLINDEKASA